MFHFYVKWDDLTDKDGNRMVVIGPAHYSQPMARQIAEEILELLKEPKEGANS